MGRRKSTDPVDWSEYRGPMCRACGCIDADCSNCIRRTGKPCAWVEVDLCSACVESAKIVIAPSPAPLDPRTLCHVPEVADLIHLFELLLEMTPPQAMPTIMYDFKAREWQDYLTSATETLKALGVDIVWPGGTPRRVPRRVEMHFRYDGGGKTTVDLNDPRM